MTIGDVNDITPRIQYTASAAQTSFDVPFPIFADADVVMLVDGVNTASFTLGTFGDTGGTLTYTGAALAGGEIVTIYRDTELSRSSDVQANGAFSSDAYNDELDKLYVIVQELRDLLAKRGLRIPLSETVTNLQLELSPFSNWLGKLLRFNSSTGVPEPVEIADLSGQALTRSLIGETFYPQTSTELTAPTNYEYEPGDVRRFGVVGDGVTDDTAALQAALNSGITDIVVPPGTYLTTSTLTLAANTKVRGVGRPAFTSTTTATNGFAIFQSASNCCFENLEFSGTSIDEAGYCAINTTGASNVIIDRCDTTGGLGEAFVLQSGSNVKVTNCHLFQTNRWSIFVVNMTDVLIENCVCDGSVNYDGVKLNTFLYGDAVTNYQNQRITIRGNICRNNNRDGIDCVGGMDTVLIHGNICDDNTLNGIEAKLNSGGSLSVQRVMVKDNACTSNGAHGVRFDDVLRSEVIDNMITDNGDFGITIDNNSEQIKVQGNQCYRNISSGIRIKGDVTVGITQDVDVSNNKCVDNGNGVESGIDIGSYVDNITIRNNDCYQLITDRQDWGINVIGTVSITNVHIIDNYIPGDKARTGAFSRGSWSGNNIHMQGNITDSSGFEAFPANDATPAVRGGRTYLTVNSSPTTITSLDQGVYEMGPFTILVDDANTTFQHGTGVGNIRLAGAVNWAAPESSSLTLICRNGQFIEIGRMAA